MALLYVVQPGRAEWSDAKRFDSAAGAPLSEEAAAAAYEIAAELAAAPVKAVISSPQEPDAQTAGILAGAMKLKPAAQPDLRELDYGLWQGLPVGEVRKRYGKVFRLWREAPGSACPPGGETFADAQQRMWAAMEKVLRRRRGQNVLVVLQPIVAGLLNCKLLGRDIDAVWENVQWAASWRKYDLDRFSVMENL